MWWIALCVIALLALVIVFELWLSRSPTDNAERREL
jgi:hypothetical protein